MTAVMSDWARADRALRICPLQRGQKTRQRASALASVGSRSSSTDSVVFRSSSADSMHAGVRMAPAAPDAGHDGVGGAQGGRAGPGELRRAHGRPTPLGYSSRPTDTYRGVCDSTPLHKRECHLAHLALNRQRPSCWTRVSAAKSFRLMSLLCGSPKASHRWT